MCASIFSTQLLYSPVLIYKVGTDSSRPKKRISQKQHSSQNTGCSSMKEDAILDNIARHLHSNGVWNFLKWITINVFWRHHCFYLQKAVLKLKPSTCDLIKEEVLYLGYFVDSMALYLSLRLKEETVQSWKTHRNSKKPNRSWDFVIIIGNLSKDSIILLPHWLY